MSNDIVELIQDEDGTYTPKHSKSKAVDKAKEVKPKKKLDRRKADEFLNGLEEGLTFVEQVGPLVSRFLKLRG